MSDDVVGVVFLGAAFLFTFFGYKLSRVGLDAVETATQEVQQTTAQAQQTLAGAQQTISQSTGPEVAAVAASGAEVAETQSAIQGAIGGMQTALNGLTGRLAPARFPFAAAAACLLVSFFAFDLVSVDLAAGDDAATSSETSSSE